MLTEEVDTKHTPKPWKFLFDKSPDVVEERQVAPNESNPNGWAFKTISIGSQNDEILAEVKAYTTTGFLQDFEQWKANAKLIAAAPDLLEALQASIEVLERHGEWSQLDRDALNKSKAAIKKATE